MSAQEPQDKEPQDAAKTIAKALARDGKFHSKTAKGRDMFIFMKRVIAGVDLNPDPSARDEGNDLVVAVAGMGCAVWNTSLPLNKFVLIEAGFNFGEAATLADVLSSVYDHLRAGALPPS